MKIPFNSPVSLSLPISPRDRFKLGIAALLFKQYHRLMVEAGSASLRLRFRSRTLRSEGATHGIDPLVMRLAGRPGSA